ncbi:MMPL family transporter [Streptomyces sp. NPDC058953]|uniref:MMPL family transporter n=1 Tax=unclassified Streptomyces TaxID=2593676 RepID=UPI003693F40A
MALSAQPRPDEDGGRTPVNKGTDSLKREGWLARTARLLARRRVPVFLIVAALTVAAGLLGAGAGNHLASGGYTPEASESSRAEHLLSDRFKAGSPNMILVAEADGPVEDAANARAGAELTERIRKESGVVFAHSFWSTKDPALRSKDGRTALILIKLGGTEDEFTQKSHDLQPDVTGEQGPLTVTATGLAPINDQIERQSAEDLTRAELLAAPLTLLILLAAFGSLVAASLPMVVGIVSVVGTLAVLRVMAEVTDVSIFAMNVTTALGFGLAVDYSLFIVTRYREELARGLDVTEAIVESLRTAGRTVLFSALTVAISLAALMVFPVYFLQSLAYAGIAVVILAAMASLLILPALLALIGRHVDRFDIFAPLRRRMPGFKKEGAGVWHWLSTRVMRRPVLIGGAVVVVLILFALPFGHARFGMTDDRILPKGASAQVAADVVRSDFDRAATAPVTVVMPSLDAAAQKEKLTEYVREVSRVEHTQRVDSAVGSWSGGRQIAPPGPASAAYSDGRGTWLSVVSDVDPNSGRGEKHLEAVRDVEAPADRLAGGDAASLVDTKAALADRIPWAAAIIALSMFVLLFLFSGSVIVPLKALVFNLLSLTASFGAMVYVFQDGHMKWLVGDFVHTGQLEVTVPLLMFCIAFGLSMDYSVFLLSRIREEYLLTGDNTRAVTFGMDHTGRLITAAALIVATVLAALATSGLSLLKLLGAGLALAVLVDATLVRGILVPAFMKLMGRANWWAPGPLRRFHDKAGLRDG